MKSAGVLPAVILTLGWAGCAYAQVDRDDSAALQSERFADEADHSIQIRDFSAAITQASRAVEIDQGNARAYNLRAVAEFGLGNYDAADRDAHTALRVLPNDYFAVDILAKVHNRLREYDQARTSAEKSLSENPQYPEAWYDLANSAAGEGRRDVMVAALSKAAELNPARFGSVYQAAKRSSAATDALSLFSLKEIQESVARPQGPLSLKALRRKEFLLIVAASAVGGVLMAFGLSHVVFRRRKGLITLFLRTVRR